MRHQSESPSIVSLSTCRCYSGVQNIEIHFYNSIKKLEGFPLEDIGSQCIVEETEVTDCCPQREEDEDGESHAYSTFHFSAQLLGQG